MSRTQINRTLLVDTGWSDVKWLTRRGWASDIRKMKVEGIEVFRVDKAAVRLPSVHVSTPSSGTSDINLTSMTQTVVNYNRIPGVTYSTSGTNLPSLYPNTTNETGRWISDGILNAEIENTPSGNKGFTNVFAGYSRERVYLLTSYSFSVDLFHSIFFFQQNSDHRLLYVYLHNYNN